MLFISRAIYARNTHSRYSEPMSGVACLTELDHKQASEQAGFQPSAHREQTTQLALHSFKFTLVTSTCLTDPPSACGTHSAELCVLFRGQDFNSSEITCSRMATYVENQEYY